MGRVKRARTPMFRPGDRDGTGQKTEPSKGSRMGTGQTNEEGTGTNTLDRAGIGRVKRVRGVTGDRSNCSGRAGFRFGDRDGTGQKPNHPRGVEPSDHSHDLPPTIDVTGDRSKARDTERAGGSQVGTGQISNHPRGANEEGTGQTT
jgi:hypothetical protein